MAHVLPVACIDESPSAVLPEGNASRPLEIRELTHRYKHFTAVDGVSLSVKPGEIAALLGPSGCGKSTLLRVIAGFVEQTAGSVLIDGQPIDHLPANRRKVGIVFQSYALFPHLTVAQNVGYGLRAEGRSAVQINDRVRHLLELVRLAGFDHRMPRELSGGQQQRVALARALAVEPAVLLLDEPFSALDKSLRLDMQLELKRLQRQFGLTVILVTHDQDEAMGVADRIAVMNHGRLEQFDTPVATYDKPATLFVSEFIGTTNRMTATVCKQHDRKLELQLPFDSTIEIQTSETFAIGSQLVLSIRPEQLGLFESSGPQRWPVSRQLSVPIGPNEMIELTTPDGGTLKLLQPRRHRDEPASSNLWCGLLPGAQPHLFSH